MSKAALVNNTLKTKSFKEKVSNSVSNLTIFQRSNESLTSELE